jgi:molybdenum-dependent DNA-binding transcriptional regulator ModE
VELRCAAETIKQFNCYYHIYEEIFGTGPIPGRPAPAVRRLSLDQLHAVVEVVRLGSFSAAARNLSLTQPAVSLQVRELEQRLGLKLIERIGKRAYATAAGTELIERARRIEREVDDALDAMRGGATAGSRAFASAPEARSSPTSCRRCCGRCAASIPTSRSS